MEKRITRNITYASILIDTSLKCYNLSAPAKLQRVDRCWIWSTKSLGFWERSLKACYICTTNSITSWCLIWTIEIKTNSRKYTKYGYYHDKLYDSESGFFLLHIFSYYEKFLYFCKRLILRWRFSPMYLQSYRFLYYSFVLLLSMVAICLSPSIFAADVSISLSSSTGWLWSNGSQVIFSPSENSATKYINTNGDATTLGNRLGWYYIDTLYGPFVFDWGNDNALVAHISGSTPLCSQWFGYKFSWFVRSLANIGSNISPLWYIRLDNPYDDGVYYCENDGMLHGFAYSDHLGRINFEGIRLERSYTAFTSTLTLDSTLSKNNSSNLLVNLFSNASGSLFDLSSASTGVLSGSWENRLNGAMSKFFPQKLVGGEYFRSALGDFGSYKPGQEEFFLVYK